MKQSQAPLFDALYEYVKNDITSFDVPGHKQGLYTNRLSELMKDVIRLDVNSMPELDLLHKPSSIIKDAQKLMADCYNFDNSLFLVNGTTAGILTMVYSSVKEGDKIAVARNVHKSVINAIILSGATPIFIEPVFDNEYMMMNNITLYDVKDTYRQHPDLKALLLVNPTYFGVIGEIDEIINFCTNNEIISLIDQAHGAHFNFFESLKFKSRPDMVAMSTHKTLGSLSQSSILLHNNKLVNYEKVLASCSMFQTTSASYLLMASLDETRRDIMTNKLHLFEQTKVIVSNARKKINLIKGISCVDDEYHLKKIDPFKLTIRVNELGFSGFEVYTMLKQEYNIQMELAECYTVLAIISIADNEDTINNLIDALEDLSSRFYGIKDEFTIKFAKHEKLVQKMSPKNAYNSKKLKLPLADCIGKISGNIIMIYPPGIPICLPGEVIDENVIKLINFYKSQTLFTISDSNNDLIEVVEE